MHFWLFALAPGPHVLREFLPQVLSFVAGYSKNGNASVKTAHLGWDADVCCSSHSNPL